MTEIDVSGCEFKSGFDNECYSDVDSTENLNCKDNPNCYYKQLKRLEQENAKLKEELAEANQLKDMYYTYYRAKHDDIKGIIFKQKEKLEKIKEYALSRMTGLACRHILSIIEGAEDEQNCR